MRWPRWIWLLIVLFAQLNIALAAHKATLSVDINKKEVLIGGPVKIMLTVKGENIRSVYWQLADRLFGDAELLKTADTIVAGAFIHQIIFTFIKPGSRQIRPLIVIVNYHVGGADTLMAQPLNIKFDNDLLITSVNDIKTVAPLPFSFADLVLLFLLPFSLVVATVLLLKGKKTRRELTAEELSLLYVQKITALEKNFQSHAIYSDVAYRLLVDFLNAITKCNANVLADFLPEIESENREALIAIINFSEKLRFGSPALAEGAIAGYLNQVKNFIGNFKTLKPGAAV